MGALDIQKKCSPILKSVQPQRKTKYIFLVQEAIWVSCSFMGEGKGAENQ
jgi:hypothetical protein